MKGMALHPPGFLLLGSAASESDATSTCFCSELGGGNEASGELFLKHFNMEWYFEGGVIGCFFFSLSNLSIFFSLSLSGFSSAAKIFCYVYICTPLEAYMYGAVKSGLRSTIFIDRKIRSAFD